MPTTTFDLHGQTKGMAIYIGVASGNRYYERTVTKAKLDTPEKLARWLLDQPLSDVEDENTFRRRLVVTWHTEEVTDEFGRLSLAKVIDSVDTQTSDEEAAWISLLGSPLATVTLTQADTAVDGISNLADAKVYLKRVNALVINLRDINKRILEVLRDTGIR